MQNMLDPYGPQMGLYMGPVWAAHMRVMWVLQQSSIFGPHGCSIWVQDGSHWAPYRISHINRTRHTSY